jgi:serine/threonine-protein kinase RsbW
MKPEPPPGVGHAVLTGLATGDLATTAAAPLPGMVGPDGRATGRRARLAGPVAPGSAARNAASGMQARGAPAEITPRGRCHRLVLPGTAEGVRNALCMIGSALLAEGFGGPVRPGAAACGPAARDSAGGHVPDTVRGSIELVLAEVLNNIVEHALADPAPEAGRCPAEARPARARSPLQDTVPGLIMLDMQIQGGALHCVVRDEGRGMPDGRLPAGRRPDLDSARDDLPEGGYGWFLIRNLTRDLRYCREPGGNRLSFAIPLEGDDLV